LPLWEAKLKTLRISSFRSGGEIKICEGKIKLKKKKKRRKRELPALIKSRDVQ
jgi:hypothetical protein